MYIYREREREREIDRYIDTYIHRYIHTYILFYHRLAFLSLGATSLWFRSLRLFSVLSVFVE